MVTEVRDDAWLNLSLGGGLALALCADLQRLEFRSLCLDLNHRPSTQDLHLLLNVAPVRHEPLHLFRDWRLPEARRHYKGDQPG